MFYYVYKKAVPKITKVYKNKKGASNLVPMLYFGLTFLLGIMALASENLKILLKIRATDHIKL